MIKTKSCRNFQLSPKFAFNKEEPGRTPRRAHLCTEQKHTSEFYHVSSFSIFFFFNSHPRVIQLYLTVKPLHTFFTTRDLQNLLQILPYTEKCMQFLGAANTHPCIKEIRGNTALPYYCA